MVAVPISLCVVGEVKLSPGGVSDVKVKTLTFLTVQQTN